MQIKQNAKLEFTISNLFIRNSETFFNRPCLFPKLNTPLSNYLLYKFLFKQFKIIQNGCNYSNETELLIHITNPLPCLPRRILSSPISPLTFSLSSPFLSSHFLLAIFLYCSSFFITVCLFFSLSDLLSFFLTLFLLFLYF
jgi:hypothetical protein